MRQVILAVERIGGVRFGRRLASELLVQMATIFAVADTRCSRGRPAICEESVNWIPLIDLAIDCWHLSGKVSAEHAGSKQPR